MSKWNRGFKFEKLRYLLFDFFKSKVVDLILVIKEIKKYGL